MFFVLKITPLTNERIARRLDYTEETKGTFCLVEFEWLAEYQLVRGILCTCIHVEGWPSHGLEREKKKVDSSHQV